MPQKENDARVCLCDSIPNTKTNQAPTSPEPETPASHWTLHIHATGLRPSDAAANALRLIGTMVQSHHQKGHAAGATDGNATGRWVHQQPYDPAYLEELWKRGAKAWEGVKDVNVWLEEVRGTKPQTDDIGRL